MQQLRANTLERMVSAVEKVRARLQRVSEILTQAKVPFAVVGGNAVAAWVAQIDEAAVRNTQDVDVLLRRQDLDQASLALTLSGFVFRHVRGIDMFLDGPDSKARDAVHILYANEPVHPDSLQACPDVGDRAFIGNTPFLELEPLVGMKLTAFRLKDRVHLLDLIEVGLIDDSWPQRYIPDLGARLQQLLDNPDS